MAGYMAIDWQTIGQEQLGKNCLEFRNVIEGPTERRTDQHRKVKICVSVTEK